jgi:hypothetical protein
MDSFLLFKSAFLNGGFSIGTARIHAHIAFRITAVQGMVFMELVWLLDWHTKLFGNLDLSINGGLLFVETATVIKLVFFVTHIDSL